MRDLMQLLIETPGRRKRLGTVVAAVAVVAAHAAPTGAIAAPIAQSSRWTFPAAIHDDGSPADQTDVAVAADAAGVVHAVWVDRRFDDASGDLYYAQLPRGADRWGANRRLAGGEAGVRSDPAVAIDTFGQVHVVWTETRGADPDIVHRFLAVGGRVWSDPEVVNDDGVGAHQAQPRVGADPFGSLHVIWVDERGGDLDIYHARRLADGTWSPNQRINNPGVGDQRDPALVVTRSGDFIAAWQDTRTGDSDIFASRLPPGGDVWWPNARLSQSTDRHLDRDAVVAADSLGRVHAVWVDDTDRSLRSATLPDLGGFWSADREVYRPRRGWLLTPAAAGGPGGQVTVAWAETRPDGSRIYAGLLPPGAAIAPTRVDASTLIAYSRRPVAVQDAWGGSHVLWEARAAATGVDVVFSTLAQERPVYPAVATEGWLEYVPRQGNCASDGFVARLCDGLAGPFVIAGAVDLAPFLGSYVQVTGSRVEDTACSAVVATAVSFKAPPCARDASAVTGILTDDGRPVEGAVVAIGDRMATTGTSGRYFLGGLTPGAAYTVTATLPCALSTRFGPFRALRGLNALPAGAFTRGEVVADCVIDVFDLVRTAAQFKSTGPFIPACSDVDGDGSIGIHDLVVIGAHYGRTCPAAWLPEEPVGDRAGAAWTLHRFPRPAR